MNKKLLFILSAAFLITGFMSNRLPDKNSILTPLYREPRQTETFASPFKVEKGGIVYTIDPVYNYELYGLVVSEHDTQHWLDYYHDRWKDHLNIKDICVLWGDNLKDNNFRKLKYRNGSWTCCYRTKDQNVWQNFNRNQLSNNHLLVDDQYLAKILLKAREGDQVHVKGYLAKYAHGKDFERGTSISRTDHGNGACETIFVKNFEIIKKGNLFWRIGHTIFKWLIVLAVGVGVYAFFKTPYSEER